MFWLHCFRSRKMRRCRLCLAIEGKGRKRTLKGYSSRRMLYRKYRREWLHAARLAQLPLSTALSIGDSQDDSRSEIYLGALPTFTPFNLATSNCLRASFRYWPTAEPRSGLCLCRCFGRGSFRALPRTVVVLAAFVLVGGRTRPGRHTHGPLFLVFYKH